MTGLQLRVYGDPFASSPSSGRMRALVATAGDCGVDVAISLTAARGDEEGRPVSLTDGVRAFDIRTGLSDAAIKAVVTASTNAVSATAPLVVFGTADDALSAGLEYPDACMVTIAGEADPRRLLDAVARHAETWPPASDEVGVDRATLQPYLDLPMASPSDNVVLHCDADDRDELERVVAALGPWLASRNWILRVQGAAARSVPVLEGLRIEAVEGALTVRTFDGVRAVAQPGSRGPSPEAFAIALASGRPIIASRCAATARYVGPAGVCLAVSGRLGESGAFVPDQRTVGVALERLVSDPSGCMAISERARRHVIETLAAPRPSVPLSEMRLGVRPVVVLEAPLFETSSSAHLTIETARALVRRGHVDVFLRPVVPFRSSLVSFQQRAPELVSRLVRRPPRADLWLSSGWPPRVGRPDASTFALRIDQEYGALPTELTPHVTDEADGIVVHSTAGQRVVTDAGTPKDRVQVVPHGVDGDAFCPDGPASQRVLDFKGDRKAVLFVGGMIWRKGFDLVVKTLLERYRESDSVCLVIKSVGGGSDYHGFHLGGLVERLQRLPGAVPVLVIEDDLDVAEMAALYRACDVLFHPYRGEGFGLPVLEARASGLPVVVTEGGSTDDFCEGEGVFRVPSVRRYIELPAPHEGLPFVCEPDADACAQALHDALKGSAAASARAASLAVRETWTWDAAAAALERMAHEALERDAVPAISAGA